MNLTSVHVKLNYFGCAGYHHYVFEYFEHSSGAKYESDAALKTIWVKPNLNLIWLGRRMNLASVQVKFNYFISFFRLSPYFNGKHHLEDIMYYENVRRSQLLTLLDKFRKVLITCTHQDPATAFHVPS
jgi:hypothetical protein